MSQYAILSDGETRTATTREIQKPQRNEVLIKNVAVASNPKDWKVTQFFPDWKGNVEGNDVAGYIEAVGEGVTDFKKGDKVAAFSRMMTHTDHGAYQEYTVAPAHTTFHLNDNVSFEEAATLPLAVMTAYLGLYVNLKLPLPNNPPKDQGIWIAVNGASSSVGAFAVQLAKLSGLKVVGIAGSSKDYAKEQGCDEIVDYRGLSDDELAKKLEQIFIEKKIKHVYDAISTGQTQILLAKALASNGGTVGVVLPVYEKGVAPYKSVTVNRVSVGTAHSKTRGDDTSEPENSELAAKGYKQIGQWLNEGIFKGNAPQIMPNGLDSVDEGLKLLKADKVSGKKLVYRIADTPAIKKRSKSPRL